ncbi:MAG: hypothetical protein JST40_08225 [Armatimonadetes bacterium]|nr:hypothetical protein [Armatimonadota bacterium]
MRPKYSLPEIERRWSVDFCLLPELADLPFDEITDRYIHNTGLRLRKVVAASGEVRYKLGKKYRETRSLTNLYLDEVEYLLFASLPAEIIRKRRYRLEGGALDVPLEPSSLPIRFEAEFPDEIHAATYIPPEFAVEEI